MADFKAALDVINEKYPGVEIELGGETFRWRMSGLSMELARKEGEDPFEMFQRLNDEAENVSLALSSMYVFLWIGLVPEQPEIELSEVKQLPVSVMQGLPVEEMIEEMISGKSMAELKAEEESQ